VQSFWGGVYSRFLVWGPRQFDVLIDRNYSFNTNLNAVFLDPVDSFPDEYDSDIHLYYGTKSNLAIELFRTLQRCKTEDPLYFAQMCRNMCVTILRRIPVELEGMADSVEKDRLTLARADCLWQLQQFAAAETVLRSLHKIPQRDAIGVTQQ
jgi:hypothetical protein